MAKPGAIITRRRKRVLQGQPYWMIGLKLSKDDFHHRIHHDLTGQKDSWLWILESEFNEEKIREFEKRGYLFQKKEEEA